MWHHFDHSTTVNGVKVIYPSSLTIDVELAYLQCLDTVIYITNSNKLGLTISDKRDTPKMRKFHIIKYPAPNTILSTRSINGVFGCQVTRYWRLCTAKEDVVLLPNSHPKDISPTNSSRYLKQVGPDKHFSKPIPFTNWVCSTPNVKSTPRPPYSQASTARNDCINDSTAQNDIIARDGYTQRGTTAPYKTTTRRGTTTRSRTRTQRGPAAHSAERQRQRRTTAPPKTQPTYSVA